MAMLNKQDALFDRSETGELIPQKVTLDTKHKEEILAIPLVRGEIKRIFADAIDGQTSKDTDKEIIMNHCIEPKFTETDVENMKPYIIQAIVKSILEISGTKEKDPKEDTEIKN